VCHLDLVCKEGQKKCFLNGGKKVKEGMEYFLSLSFQRNEGNV